MNRPLYVFLAILFFLAACTNDDTAGSTILSQPIFAGITDSIEKAPKDDALYFRRAILLNKNNFPGQALGDFQKAWSLQKKEQYALGISSLLLERKPDSAIVFIHEALKELPQSVLLQISLARSYEALGNTAEAVKVYDGVLKEYPDQLNVLMMKVDLLKNKQDTTDLIATLERAYRLAPGNKEVSYNLAYQYADNRSPRALSLADSLISADSSGTEAEPYYIKGFYYAGIKNDEKAIEWFNKTIQHDHNHLNALIEKGKIYFNQKKISDAQKAFQLANTISPAFPDAYYWLGRCQEVNGQKEDARLSYEKAYGLDKTFTEAKEAADKLN